MYGADLVCSDVVAVSSVFSRHFRPNKGGVGVPGKAEGVSTLSPLLLTTVKSVQQGKRRVNALTPASDDRGKKYLWFEQHFFVQPPRPRICLFSSYFVPGDGYVVACFLSRPVLLLLAMPAGVRDGSVQGLHPGGCHATRHCSGQRKRETRSLSYST